MKRLVFEMSGTRLRAWLGSARFTSVEAWRMMRALSPVLEGIMAEHGLEEGPPTLAEAEEALIRGRIDEMRPDASWQEIADSLGTTKKTLWEKRKTYGMEIDYAYSRNGQSSS